jgi:hypothetical protein
MRIRLRPTPTPAELAELYPRPHNHLAWGVGHDFRVRATIALGEWLMETGEVRSIADLSCGDAHIARRLAGMRPVEVTLGDFAPGYPICGQIERTVHEIPPVDLFICSETIEHIDNPDGLLNWIQARWLLLSTPIGETDGGNREHVWGWDVEGVDYMLAGAGWRPLTRVDVETPGTTVYQVWLCERVPGYQIRDIGGEAA